MCVHARRVHFKAITECSPLDMWLQSFFSSITLFEKGTVPFSRVFLALRSCRPRRRRRGFQSSSTYIIDDRLLMRFFLPSFLPSFLSWREPASLLLLLCSPALPYQLCTQSGGSSSHTLMRVCTQFRSPLNLNQGTTAIRPAQVPSRCFRWKTRIQTKTPHERIIVNFRR